jgi:hypothetical protein
VARGRAAPPGLQHAPDHRARECPRRPPSRSRRAAAPAAAPAPAPAARGGRGGSPGRARPRAAPASGLGGRGTAGGGRHRPGLGTGRAALPLLRPVEPGRGGRHVVVRPVVRPPEHAPCASRPRGGTRTGAGPAGGGPPLGRTRRRDRTPGPGRPHRRGAPAVHRPLAATPGGRRRAGPADRHRARGVPCGAGGVRRLSTPGAVGPAARRRRAGRHHGAGGRRSASARGGCSHRRPRPVGGSPRPRRGGAGPAHHTGPARRLGLVAVASAPRPRSGARPPGVPGRRLRRGRAPVARRRAVPAGRR